jgi:hypothetical protein
MRKRLSQLLGAALFTLLALEISLQGLFWARSGTVLATGAGRPPMHAVHSSSGFFNRPNLDVEHTTSEFRSRIFTNSEGLRVPRRTMEYEHAKASDAMRVLLLGPSFAFGWGVNYEQSFAARLAEWLDIEVINAGVPALGPFPQLKWYEAIGRSYEVDAVIQIVHGSPEVSRTFDNYSVDERGYLVANDRTALDRVIALGKRSGLLFYAWVISTRLAPALPVEIYGAGRKIRAPRPFAGQDAGVRESLAYYVEFRDRVSAEGAIPLVVFAPLPYIVHQADAARWRHLGVIDVPAHAEFNRRFCAVVTSTVLPCVDLTAPLRAAARSGAERLYHWLDIHWTPRGNDVAARATADVLKTRGFPARILHSRRP